MEAQRYPADYDGIIAGDSANFMTTYSRQESGTTRRWR